MEDSRLAIIAIIIENKNAVEKINELLHSCAPFIIGRMGMPYPKKNVSIITVIVDAPQDIISTLSGKLGQIKDVSIKTTYSKV
jgi:putative iron-only hydrogenase system regulator